MGTDAEHRKRSRTTHRVEQSARLAAIDHELFWHGQVTRGWITDRFGVSVETAKADLKLYRQHYPKGLSRSVSTGALTAANDFEPVIARDPDPDSYLATLPAHDAVPVALVPEIERRAVDQGVLRAVIRAIMARREIAVTYHTPRRAEATRIWILPHAFAHDGFRWAVRCWWDWPGGKGYWGEMVLDRLEAVTDERAADPVRLGRDDQWNTVVEVELAANPGLDPRLRGEIEQQYSMTDGRVVVPVRQCLLVYFLKRHQIEEPVGLRAPHQAPLVLRNRDAVVALLPEGMRVPLANSDARAPRLMRELRARLPGLDEQAILERALDLLATSLAEGEAGQTS